MLEIDITNIPDFIEEKDKFNHYMESVLDAFRVDPKDVAELKVVMDDSHNIHGLFYAICNFLTAHVNDDLNTLVIIRNNKGRLILRKIRNFQQFKDNINKTNCSGASSKS